VIAIRNAAVSEFVLAYLSTERSSAASGDAATISARVAGFHQQGEQVELQFADGTTRDDPGRPPSGVAALE
jgi:hypothetical protein